MQMVHSMRDQAGKDHHLGSGLEVVLVQFSTSRLRPSTLLDPSNRVFHIGSLRITTETFSCSRATFLPFLCSLAIDLKCTEFYHSCIRAEFCPWSAVDRSEAGSSYAGGHSAACRERIQKLTRRKASPFLQVFDF